jgi:hypothetical protein
VRLPMRLTALLERRMRRSIEAQQEAMVVRVFVLAYHLRHPIASRGRPRRT